MPVQLRPQHSDDRPGEVEDEPDRRRAPIAGTNKPTTRPIAPNAFAIPGQVHHERGTP
uniref:hypothetical protein n=1 Tax=Saccharothrix mutabilis TaxID=33921 RepID=UPI0031CDBE37